jgi:hypothetical protein
MYNPNFGGSSMSFFANGSVAPHSIVNNAYGSFYDTTTQTSLGNENVPMKLNNTDTSSTYGFSIQNDNLGNPTQIVAGFSGVYNLQFSAQVTRSSGGTKSQLYIWFAKQGIYVPDSATTLTLANNTDFIVPAWNFFVSLNANEYVQLYWRGSVPEIELLYNTSVDGVPKIPSVIATIQKVAEL